MMHALKVSILSLLSIGFAANAVAGPREDFMRAGEQRRAIPAEERIKTLLANEMKKFPPAFRIELGEEIKREYEEIDSEGGRHQYVEYLGRRFYASSAELACAGEILHYEADKISCFPR